MSARTRGIIWAFVGLGAIVAAASGAQGATLAARGAGYVLAIVSLVVLTGWSGQLNLHVAAIGLGWGAYAYAGLVSYGAPPLLALIAAPFLVVPAALLVGMVAVRFRGLELAIATLAAGLAFEQMAFQSLGQWLGHTTEGSAFESSLVSVARPALFDGDRAYAVLALVIAAIWVAVAAAAGRGRAGRTLMVVRDREVVAEARGIAVFAWRVGAFALSSAIAAAGGALLAGQTGAVTPDAFNFSLSLQLLAVATMCGIRRLEAGLIGAAVILLAQEAGGIAWLAWLSGDRADLAFGIGLIAALAVQARKRPVRPAPAPASTLSDEPLELSISHVSGFAHTVLRVEDVQASFATTRVLQGIDLRVGRGEVVGLVGGNGTGKTTLFNCITGLVTPDDGRVFFAGEDITDLAPHHRARRGLARTFQGVEVFAGLTVREGLILAASLRPSVGATNGDRARTALEAVGIPEVLDAQPSSLPFATLRLVEIATALVSDPQLVLLDEPLAGLDTAERTRVLIAIEGLRAQDRSVLIVEHDRASVATIADRTYELVAGRAVERPREAAVVPARRARNGRNVRKREVAVAARV